MAAKKSRTGVSRLVAGPPSVYRVARWPDPFAFPPPPDPLPKRDLTASTPARAAPLTVGNRWDDPKGEYSTLYLATIAEGAFAETLARFREKRGQIEKIDRFFDGKDADPGEPELEEAVVPPDWPYNRTIGEGRFDADARFVDVDHPDTHSALFLPLKRLRVRYGFPDFDRGVMMGPDRRITRQVARYYYDLSLTPDHQEISGLRYESRLSGEWENWVAWEPLPVTPTSRKVSAVTWANPDLRAAVKKLKLTLPAGLRTSS